MPQEEPERPERHLAFTLEERARDIAALVELPIWKQASFLLRNQHLAEKKDKQTGNKPNCYGTLCYYLGVLRRPRFVEPTDMEPYIAEDIEDGRLVQGAGAGGIITVTSEERFPHIDHVGLITHQNEGRTWLVDQMGTGGEFRVLALVSLELESSWHRQEVRAYRWARPEYQKEFTTTMQRVLRTRRIYAPQNNYSFG